MTVIRISYLPNGERDREPKGVDLTWDQLGKALGADGIEVKPCTLETCGKGANEYVWIDKAGKERRGGCKHKYVGAWSPAVYPPGATRSKKNVGVVSLLVLDLDHMTDADVARAAEQLAPYQYIAHSSHGDLKPAMRPLPDDPETLEQVTERALRVVVELSEPVLGTDWPRFWETAVRFFGGDADPATCDASRLYFLPTRRADAPGMYTTNPGKPLDVRAILAMAPPPEALPELAGPSGEFGAASPALIERARDRLRRIGPAIEGQGGDRHTYSACCAMLYDFALSDAEAWPLLVEWNATCVPPWAHDDLRVKMENAKSYAEGQRGQGRIEFESAELLAEVFGTFDADTVIAAPIPLPEKGELEVPPEGDVLAILGNISAKVAEPVGEPGTYPYELDTAKRELARAMGSDAGDGNQARPLFTTARELLARAIRATSWLVRGLIVEGGVAAIIGEPKTTKSWLALDLALSVASGQDAFGEFKVPRARPAAYFFAEDLEDSITSRIRAFAAGRGMRAEDLATNLHVQPRGLSLDLSKDEDVAKVIASCRLLGPLGLLVLDPLRDVHTGKENESDDMAAVFKRLRMISKLLDCTVLIVHHSKKVDPKNAGSNGSEIRGSSVINGSLDSRIILKGLTGDKTATFTNTMETLVKAGRSAGTRSITLTIVDDPKTDQAVSAVWKVEKESDAKAAAAADEMGDGVVEDHAVVLVEKMLWFEARKMPAQNVAQLRDAIKGGMPRLQASLAFASARGWVLKSEGRGRYVLTDLGRQVARGETAEQSSPAASIDDLE